MQYTTLIAAREKEEMSVVKKGIAIWIFSSLTFVSLLHLIDAISALLFNSPIRLLQLYPVINEKVQNIAPTTYFWISAVVTFTLWGITCGIAFENPVETFLSKIVSDAKKQSAVETQLLEDKSEVLDAMCETIEADNQILAQVKDLVYNVRVDVKEIQPLKENLEKIRTEVGSLKKDIKKIEDKTLQFENICPACGKPLLAEFNMCPYCGENVKLARVPVISVKDYK
jgi:rRNA maturation endonuclease Nob1